MRRRRTKFSADHDDRAVSVGTIRGARRLGDVACAARLNRDYIEAGIRPSLPNRTAHGVYGAVRLTLARHKHSFASSNVRGGRQDEARQRSTFAGMSIFFSPPL